MGERHKAEPASNIENRLQTVRMARGLSQTELARLAGITRQAVCAIEANQYLPTTAVALRLAAALRCRVEDLFNLFSTGELIEGDWLAGGKESVGAPGRMRAKIACVGGRYIVRPVDELGEMLSYVVPADGIVVADPRRGRKAGQAVRSVRVRLLRDLRAIEQEIAVAGCDPAIFLAGEYLRRRKDACRVTTWMMGSSAAIEALKRGEVHLAGVHVVDAKSGVPNLPYLRRHFQEADVAVVTFASWEEGLIVGAGNPKSIRGVADVVRRNVRLVNRESGAGVRFLLDQRLSALGIRRSDVRGYDRTASSHFEVARLISEGRADVGVGIRSVARLFGLDFIPLQEARFDLVVPKTYLAAHPSIEDFLDTIVSRPFRTELETLGGYNTSETGTIRSLNVKREV